MWALCGGISIWQWERYRGREGASLSMCGPSSRALMGKLEIRCEEGRKGLFGRVARRVGQCAIKCCVWVESARMCTICAVSIETWLENKYDLFVHSGAVQSLSRGSNLVRFALWASVALNRALTSPAYVCTISSLSARMILIIRRFCQSSINCDNNRFSIL